MTPLTFRIYKFKSHQLFEISFKYLKPMLLSISLLMHFSISRNHTRISALPVATLFAVFRRMSFIPKKIVICMNQHTYARTSVQTATSMLGVLQPKEVCADIKRLIISTQKTFSFLSRSVLNMIQTSLSLVVLRHYAIRTSLRLLLMHYTTISDSSLCWKFQKNLSHPKILFTRKTLFSFLGRPILNMIRTSLSLVVLRHYITIRTPVLRTTRIIPSTAQTAEPRRPVPNRLGLGLVTFFSFDFHLLHHFYTSLTPFTSLWSHPKNSANRNA